MWSRKSFYLLVSAFLGDSELSELADHLLQDGFGESFRNTWIKSLRGNYIGLNPLSIIPYETGWKAELHCSCLLEAVLRMPSSSYRRSKGETSADIRVMISSAHWKARDLINLHRRIPREDLKRHAPALANRRRLQSLSQQSHGGFDAAKANATLASNLETVGSRYPHKLQQLLRYHEWLIYRLFLISFPIISQHYWLPHAVPPNLQTGERASTRGTHMAN